jgi:nitrogen fixation-related uncharacterized protein
MVANIWGVPVGIFIAAVAIYILWWLEKTADKKDVKK